MTRVGELRVGRDRRARAFVIFDSPQETSARISWGEVGEPARDFVRKFSATETARLLQTEKWRRGLTDEEIKKWLKRWRAQCVRDGFTESYEVLK